MTEGVTGPGGKLYKKNMGTESANKNEVELGRFTPGSCDSVTAAKRPLRYAG